MKLTTAQYRVLKIARKSNAENRGLIPPKGPAGTTFARLRSAGLLRLDEFRDGHWITSSGAAELARVEGSTP